MFLETFTKCWRFFFFFRQNEGLIWADSDCYTPNPKTNPNPIPNPNPTLNPK